MNSFITIFILVSSLFRQSANCKIEGSIGKNLSYKYAYLVDLKKKTIEFAPLTNRRFTFVAQKEDDFLLMRVFLSSDSAIDYNSYRMQLSNRLIDTRLIACEDLTIIVEGDIKSAIIEGGKYNADIDEMDVAIKNKQYASFFATHHESPLSIIFLSSLITVNKHFPLLDGQEIKSFYENLSVKLKASKEGKDLLKKIENL